MDILYFKTYVLPLKDQLYRFALSILRSESEAADVVQDVFLKIWNRKKNKEEINNEGAWCMQITRNLCLDRLKSSRVKMTKSLNEESNPYLSPVNLQSDIESRDLLSLIAEIMKDLPLEQAEVIHLRDIEGYSYDEIAEIIGIKLSQVKSQLHRGRKELKKRMEQIDNYGL